MILAISGQVAAHGANSYAIIVRNESVMPESADLIVNDTLVLYNTAAWEGPQGSTSMEMGHSNTLAP